MGKEKGSGSTTTWKICICSQDSGPCCDDTAVQIGDQVYWKNCSSTPVTLTPTGNKVWPWSGENHKKEAIYIPANGGESERYTINGDAGGYGYQGVASCGQVLTNPTIIVDPGEGGNP